MRLLIWSQYFWPENFVINQLAQAVQKLGPDVSILTGKPNYPGGKVFDGYRAAGFGYERFGIIDVFRVPIIPRGKRSRLRLAANYISFVFSALFFAPVLLRKKAVDVVFIYAPSPLLQALPALLFGFFRRVPVVLWVQDLWPESLTATGLISNGLLLRSVRTLVRVIYKHVDLVLVQSEAFRDPIGRFVTDPNKIVYFPNPAESMTQGDDSEGCENSLADRVGRKFSIVFAGNIGTVQACETIVRAAELLQGFPDIQFFLVGDGSHFDSIRAEISKRGLVNVQMPGRLPVNEMGAVFTAAQALLVTLRRDPVLTLTVPSKLQAYLAAGRPVIACLDGEAARIVQEAEAGLTCSAEDFEGLASAVKKLYLMPPEDRERLGENAAAYFSAHFDMTVQATRLLEILRIVVRRP